MRPLKPALSTLMAATAVGLALTGCRYDGLGRQASSSSSIAWPATTEAPYPQDYQAPRGYYDTAPPPARVPVARLASNDDGWAWAERSYWLDQAFYDTPPDYGFYYDDYQPWVWQTDDRWSMYGDPYGDDYYYYYYQPGAVRPYFIRDDRYGYGYDDVGRLVTVISLLTGQMMPQSFLNAQDPYASRYYQRAYLVREASLRADPIVITRDIWLERQPTIVRSQNVWIQQATSAPAWVQYRQRSGDRDLRRFEGARQQRLNTLVAVAPQQQQGGWLGRNLGGRSDKGVQTAALSGRQEARMADQLRSVERRQQQDRQDLAKRMPRNQRQAFEAQTRELQRGDRRDIGQQVRQQAADQQRLAKAQSAQERRDVQKGLAAEARDRGQAQNQRLAQIEQRGQQRQAEAQARDQQRGQQRQAEAQARQQQQQAQRQSEEQARDQQRGQQRQAEAQARQQQQQAQRQSEAQARDQQRGQQRQAEAQARQQQQQAQRQSEAQAREQQRGQQRQAEAQARQQQQQAQRQSEAQSRQQQQQAQRQAESQARQQQAQQAQQAQQQQKAQRQEKAQAKQQPSPQEANAEPGAKGHGRDKKG